MGRRRATGASIKHTLPAYTDFYLLAAIDLQRDDQGNIVAAPPRTRSIVDVLIRTFVVSALRDADLPAARLSAGVPDRDAPARSPTSLLILVLLPFWTSLLVRTTAWVVLLQSRGVVNSALVWLGVIDPRSR